ncbi:hypothetical protein [Paraflavitalea speifideaquila]|nr:hypothetical protein [Paraflavitalea speifideiaquila]
MKLVLIPDKEDPDSYVNKIGAAQFQDFIKANKKISSCFRWRYC